MQKFIIILTFLLISPSAVISEENNYFLSLKKDKVYVRFGPGKNYPIKYIYNKKFLTIKVIDKKDNYRKIIDHKKNSGWIHQIMLRRLNSLIVLEEKIVFKKNSKFSKPLAKLEKGRLVIIKKCKINWCRIETGNYIGWIDTKNVWGI
tara:strand:+ start:59 stop:502 length:444 start_codon:yes stop_codon:yes gene_type:complete